MIDDNDSDTLLLRKIARQTTISAWTSGCCLAVLIAMIFFPQQTAWVSERSVEFQQTLAPHMSGILGFLFALAFIVPTAAYILSRVSPTAPREMESENKK